MITLTFTSQVKHLSKVQGRPKINLLQSFPSSPLKLLWKIEEMDEDIKHVEEF